MNSRDIFPPPPTRKRLVGTPAAYIHNSIQESEARGEVDRQYATIVRRIHAYIEIEGAADYENFVRTLNINIAKTVAAMGKRRGKQQQPEEVI